MIQLSEHIFNSRDKEYKSPYGAVPSGGTVTFRLLLPESPEKTSGARMSIIRDSDGYETIHEFKPSGEYLDNRQFWEMNLTAESPGLYWYCFEYESSSKAIKRIYRGNFSTGYTDIPECRWQLTVYDAELKVPGDFKGGIMYQIFPDRFFNSGTDKKNVPDDRVLNPWSSEPEWRPNFQGRITNSDYLGGDIKGIEEKLPYIKSLGVSVIYLNPIFEAHSNHRYNTACYERIDPLLGTQDDFTSLCNSAHKMGIKIILDGVFSHTGDDSIYFNKYKRYDSVGAYNATDSKYFDWYKFEQWPDKYTSWWGIDILPEVIEETPSYMEYIAGPGGIVEKWLKCGADGWRLDVADELPDEFIEAIHDRVKQTNPDALLLGEVWEDASNKTAYSTRRRYLLGKELDSVMNYPFKDAIIDFIANDHAENFIDRILTITENYPKEILDVLMNPLGTHDTMRILSRLSGEDCEGKDRQWQSLFKLTLEQRTRCIRLLKVASVMQYTLPGFPSVYYGDEIGMEGCKDPFNRFGFTWDNMDSDLLQFFRELGSFRNSISLLRDAEFIPISGAMGCVAYARVKNDNALIVIANRAPTPIQYYLPEKYSDCVPVFGSSEVNGNCVTVGAEEYAVLGYGKIF